MRHTGCARCKRSPPGTDPLYAKRALQPRPAPDPLIVASVVDVLLADFSDVEQVPLRADVTPPPKAMSWRGCRAAHPRARMLSF